MEENISEKDHRPSLCAESSSLALQRFHHIIIKDDPQGL